MGLPEMFRRAIRENELAHAFLIEGEEPEAREAAVRELASAILCQDPVPSARPCGFCASCRKMHAGTHEDVVTMTQSGKTQYLVQDANQFVSRLAMSPYGEYLVGIIPNAENLSEIVQNKLLKTLEEPCPGTVLLLSVRNRESLLETVRSRCVLLRLGAGDGQDGADAGILELWEAGFTHEFRKGMEKKVKSQEEALCFLDGLEDIAGARRDAGLVRLIEAARRDILLGMGYRPALKRLYLEAHQKTGRQ